MPCLEKGCKESHSYTANGFRNCKYTISTTFFKNVNKNVSLLNQICYKYDLVDNYSIVHVHLGKKIHLVFYCIPYINQKS